MKKLFALTVLLFTIQSHSQTYIKANAITALVAIPNVAVETSISEKLTLNVDLMASFWESFDGKSPMKFVTFTPEVRYHFNEKYNGLYFGGHIGGDIYKIQKWNYWDTNKYEDGHGYRLGATLGYQKKLNDKFMLDFLLVEDGIKVFIKAFTMMGHQVVMKKLLILTKVVNGFLMEVA
ncbi:DUF3575 domain-containing protein [Flavobacterium sp. 140616W15]|uniref:DUF3575 domain-containing protein n=1 Tax=Flavobacterium sp. 140616W15 TaxID=2478552 RepID=UPI0026AC7A14